MSRTELIKIINEFKKITPPSSSANEELANIASDLMLDFSDYIHWERVFIENKITERDIVSIKQWLGTTGKYIEERLKKIEIRSEDDKSFKEKLLYFNSKMLVILQKIVEENEERNNLSRH